MLSALSCFSVECSMSSSAFLQHDGLRLDLWGWREVKLTSNNLVKISRRYQTELNTKMKLFSWLTEALGRLILFIISLKWRIPWLNQPLHSRLRMKVLTHINQNRTPQLMLQENIYRLPLRTFLLEHAGVVPAHSCSLFLFLFTCFYKK